MQSFVVIGQIREFCESSDGLDKFTALIIIGYWLLFDS